VDTGIDADAEDTDAAERKASNEKDSDDSDSSPKVTSGSSSSSAKPTAIVSDVVLPGKARTVDSTKIREKLRKEMAGVRSLISESFEKVPSPGDAVSDASSPTAASAPHHVRMASPVSMSEDVQASPTGSVPATPANSMRGNQNVGTSGLHCRFTYRALSQLLKQNNEQLLRAAAAQLGLTTQSADALVRSLLDASVNAAIKP